MTRFLGEGEDEGSRTERGRRIGIARERRRQRSRTRVALELLEGRTLLSYTFSLLGTTATATGDAAGDVLTIDQDSGLLRHRVDGGAFSDDWDDLAPGPQTLAADAASTVKIVLGGSDEAIVLGTPDSPASTLFAQFQLSSTISPNTSSVTIDDGGSTDANVYSIDSVGGSISGNGINFDETDTPAFQAGNTVKGSAADNTFNVLSTYMNGPAVEAITIVDGGSGTVNVGKGGDMAGIAAPLTIVSTGGTTTLNLDDQDSVSSKTATLTVDNGADTGSVSGLSPGAIHFTPSRLAALSLNGGSGGNTFTVDGTPAGITTTLSSGTGSDTVDVLATSGDLFVAGQDGDDSVTLGSFNGVQDIQRPVTVSNTDGATTLVVNDSGDPTGRDISIAGGTISGLAPAAIAYSGVSHLIVQAGEGSDAVTILNPDVSADLVVDTCHGNDTIDLLATTVPVSIDAEEDENTVNLGDSGSLAGIQAPLTISSSGGTAALNLDDTSDPIGRDMTLVLSAGLGTLSGLAPASIAYDPDSVQGVSIEAGTGDDTLTVDFSAGNPIANSGGVIYDGGDGDDTLNLQGGAFGSEHYEAFGPGEGALALDNSSGVVFLNLEPINDIVPVIDFSFHASPGTFLLNLVDGPVFGGFQTAQFNSGPAPTFERMNFANKTSVSLRGSTSSTVVTIDNPTPADGLESLSISTGARKDTLNLVTTPAAVSLAVDLGEGDDLANVHGLGVAAGTTVVLDGGPASNTLVYDAGGAPVSIVAGANPGEVVITPAGGGDTDASNFDEIVLLNPEPTPPVAGPVETIHGVEGTELVDATVATFTSQAPGAIASDFLATITWGDGTVSAGTIVQRDGTPSTFDVNGSHTYARQGVYAIDVSISSTGSEGTIDAGVPVTVVTSPGGPVATIAGANVANAPLVVTVFPLVGTEGIAIPAEPIATFLDLGGAHPASSYTAMIEIRNAQNQVLLSVPAASITQNAGTSSYTVNAPSFDLGKPGTYTVRVTVTDNDLPDPVSMTGAAQAVIAAADISVSGVAVSATEGLAFSGVVAAFTVADTLADPSDFTATIRWGDGKESLGTVTIVSPGTFQVSGTNTYARAGSYQVLVTIAAAGGQSALGGAAATVADAAMRADGLPITVPEAQPFRRPVASFTSASPLAAAADFTATINWGDGTPNSPGTITQGTDGTFFVEGSHTYADNTLPGAPRATTITIRDQGGATSIVSGTATVVDGPMASAGATVAAAEATLWSGVVATFTDSGGQSQVGNYTAFINWGDGNVSGGAISVLGSSPAGLTYVVNGSHTYARQGTYAVFVSIASAGGSATLAGGTAFVAAAPMSMQAGPISAAARVALVNVVAATFTQAGTAGAAGIYEARINWGDGTPPSDGVVVSSGAGYRVLGSHTYAVPRGYTYAVSVRDQSGVVTTAYGTAVVRGTTVKLTGHVEPAPGPGGITRTSTPTFVGTANPGSTVQLFAVNPRLVPSRRRIGRATANGAGQWRLTSVRLPDGIYAVVAQATAPGRGTVTAALRPLIIRATAALQARTSAVDAALASVNVRSLARKHHRRGVG